MRGANDRPKAGVEIAGLRFEAHFLYRLKRQTDHPRAIAQRVGKVVPPTILVRILTRLADPEARRRWQDQGLLRWARPVLDRGRLRIPYGGAEGMWLSAGLIDVAGAQTFHMVRGTHELMVQEALRRSLPQGGVFFDVGANVGLMSLVAARCVGPGGQVVSIDPEPSNAAALRAHALLNRLDTTMIVVHGAAADRSGPVEVIAVADTLWTRVAEVGPHPLERERLVVDGFTLDDLVDRDGLRPPDVVKIDVEGGELMVLEGMTRLLADQRPVLILEMHGKNRPVSELLEAAGYELENLDGPGPVTEADDNVHALARPR